MVPCRIWREPGTLYNIENLTSFVKHGGGGIMVWDHSLVRVVRNINRHDYINILNDNFFIHSFKVLYRLLFTQHGMLKHGSLRKKQNFFKMLADWPSFSIARLESHRTFMVGITFAAVCV